MKRPMRIVLWAIGVLTAACAGDDGTGPIASTANGSSATFVTTTTGAVQTTTINGSVPGTNPTGSTSGTTTEATTEMTTATTTATTSVAVVGNPVVQVVLVGEFDHPVDLAIRPGDSSLYIVEQSGRVVRSIDGASTIVADVSDRITAGGERGLLALAFSPDGTFAYFDYTDRGGDTVIAQYPVAADGVIDVSSERAILQIDQPYSNHNGGDLEFGPDGMLYVSLGDGGSANDPQRRASDTFSLLGKLLRIDPTQESGDTTYLVPPDNPFADGVNGAPEVWSWGLRNPWRFAFDPTNGDLWIADVGQNRYEEIDHVESLDGVNAGRAVNFGWSAFEGTDRFNDDVTDAGDTTFPVLTYEHGADGCSVSGGVPYHGVAIPELEPAYVYSDYCSGKLWAFDEAGQRNLLLLDQLGRVSSVRTGPNGETYILELGGRVSQLSPG
jgi:glucose/arabinose dehydrogenase